eukprot:11195736-Karenia_brevis.AAC.1
MEGVFSSLVVKRMRASGSPPPPGLSSSSLLLLACDWLNQASPPVRPSVTIASLVSDIQQGVTTSAADVQNDKV